MAAGVPWTKGNLPWVNLAENYRPGTPDASGIVERFVCIRLGWGDGSSPIGPALLYNTNHGCRGVLDVYASNSGTGSSAVRELVVVTDWNGPGIPEGFEEVSGGSVIEPDPSLNRMEIQACACSGGATVSRFVLRSDEAHGSYPADTDLPANSSIFDPNVDNVWFRMVSQIKPVGGP